MTYLDQSDSNTFLSENVEDMVLVDSRMSNYIILGGIGIIIATIAAVVSENFSKLNLNGTISLFGTCSYLFYSSFLILLIGLIFKDSVLLNKKFELFKNRDNQFLLLIFLMILLLTVFPILDKLSERLSYFLLPEFLYGALTIFIFTSITKNIMSSK
ncbi:MAG: hypothetical protein ACP5MU_01135 [Thermoplasmata archaeon]